jgi:hypothetical protein
MSNRFLLALAGMLVLAALVSSVSLAGNNASGQAFLSWAAGDLVTRRDTAQALFPVYVHVDGASSIRGLSVCLRWYPDSYVLVDPPLTWRADVGYNTNVAPPPVATSTSPTCGRVKLLHPVGGGTIGS